MKSIQVLGKALLVLAAGLAAAHASDFTGVYARIDKVVLEPNSDSPDTIQIWGVFALANPENRNDYLPPARGYLYFKRSGASQTARNEWNDLKQMAATGEVVAFGGRGNKMRLRKADEKPADPDSYATNIGVQKVRGRTDYPPVRAVLDFKN